MMRAPTFFDHLFNIGFFVVMNGVLLVPTWHKSRRATGPFRVFYFVAIAPVVVLVWSLSWQWLFDVTAGNLWPIALVMLGVPCWIAWLLIAWFERRNVEKDRPFSR